MLERAIERSGKAREVKQIENSALEMVFKKSPVSFKQPVH
jgi:hypothetical protein